MAGYKPYVISTTVDVWLSLIMSPTGYKPYVISTTVDLMKSPVCLYLAISLM